MTRRYEKWRELGVDPFSINFKNIKLEEIVSYFPAGNDVLECRTIIDNDEAYLIVKIERSKMANFSNELKILDFLSDSLKSKYLKEYGRSLARIHNIHISNDLPLAQQRVINDYPKEEIYLKKFDSFISSKVDYLINNKPKIKYDTFIHGDYHYANILWII